jgi:hypothetical protein
MTDIDIDFADRSKILKILDHIPATIKDKDSFKKHNTGVYCQRIPVNPLTNLASIDYKEADSRGYFKIDFLNVSIYKDIKDEAHLKFLMEAEPLWELLEQKEFTDLLFHLNGHHGILQMMKPKNMSQLAAVLAMIRPAKRYLIGESWDTIMKEVWTKPTTDEYYFKQAHSFSYAMVIIVHMNLICQNISSEYS